MMTQAAAQPDRDLAAGGETLTKELAAVLQLPDCPRLAQNVQLLGEMQGTGFKDQQWLVQRDGRYIQLTELLYRIVEQANGQQTLEEIAERVTEATDRVVTQEQIRLLLQTKLVPLRLIDPAGGVAFAPPSAEVRSPLQAQLRMKTFGPRLIDPIAKVLQVLYAPPVLVPMLIAIGIAHGWLFFVHGVVNSLNAVLYAPGLTLVVVAICLVSGVFHEFGHAAALRYGGGRARKMGVGIYLFYPMLYTDTTDSYRLSRWARVRTDLGGFYFSLIFALGVMALYWASGQEFLLLVVVIIGLDILYQSLVFVRFDGYWVLADLTGIPDFFSQMAAFVRSALPIPRWKGAKLPDLKPWVKAVFAAYILVTIPVLALIFLGAIRIVPTTIMTAWDSWHLLSRDFAYAQSNRDLLGVAAAVTQMLILALPVLGLLFLLYICSRQPLTALWHWSIPSARRRVIGGLGAVTAVAGLALLWAPQLPLFATETVGPPDGVETFDVVGRTHVQLPVSYPQLPPVGGPHAPVWQNCGFYETPVANENAVHSMEHGAVWITYQPHLPKDQVDLLHGLVRGHSYVLVSPSPDLPAAVVASAWGRQLRVDSADDPRLDQFVQAFEKGPQTPERGAPCDGGIGSPR
jgi:hypothetical protein